MHPSYAVIWRENGGPSRSGKLDVGTSGLRLDTGGELRELPFDELVEIRVGREEDERLAGRPVLVAQSSDGTVVHIATVGEVGALLELVDRIAEYQNGRAAATTRLVVVVPLRPGAQEHVRALLERGPPFDPVTAGLERHDVFVTEREAVFVFEGPSSPRLVERLLVRPSLWRAAAQWRAYLAGPPRLAQAIYTWQRREPASAAAAV